MRKVISTKPSPKHGTQGECLAKERKLAARRERDRARRQAKRTAEVWAMPADEVPTEEKGKYNTFFEVVEDARGTAPIGGAEMVE